MVRRTFHSSSLCGDYRMPPPYTAGIRQGERRLILAARKNIRDTVREAITPTVEQLGYRIWDVTYEKVGTDYHLEVTIDSDDGIGIEDCERVHRAIDPILDEKDPIEGFYYLEVSSTGVERELRTPEHITASLGQPVEAKLFTAKDGRKSVTGTLRAFDGRVLLLATPEGELSLEKSEISRLKTLYFEEDGQDDGNHE